MIRPICAYGHPVLKRQSDEIPADYKELNQLIEDMENTMEDSHGVGLAAPQIGVSLNLFIADARDYADEYPEAKDFRKVFINAEVVEESGEEWSFREGCLSVPGINEYVDRKSVIRIKYQDENFNFHDEVYSGILARIIQHEYDHTIGFLFVDRLSPVRKLMIKRKLHDIIIGRVDVHYKMEFPVKKKKKG